MAAQLPLAKLAGYKQAIDADIAAYSERIRKSTLKQYGSYILDTDVDVFLDVLSRGGKRIRGALVMAGYEMCGGKDQQMIVQAARAIEMLHAHMLIIDDVQDRSALRRGRSSAHVIMAGYARRHKLKDDPDHIGISMALNASLIGSQSAMGILANLDADPGLRLHALSIVSRTLVVTAHGQTLDILNELVDEPAEADIERVLEWKTALYTVINPLHVGMVLAGADCGATDAITPYGLHAGKAFQITDDILGIFGDEKELGKTPGDDIREGKGTLLVLYALKHAGDDDRVFLRGRLGNPKLTATEFDRCRQIIKDSGALAHARKIAAGHLNKALAALDQARGLWSTQGSDFLRELALALQNRVA